MKKHYIPGWCDIKPNNNLHPINFEEFEKSLKEYLEKKKTRTD
jgi:hypothetical protein